MYKLSGAETTRQEAIDLLGPLGPIAKVHPLDLNSQKTDKFPPAMVVHYKRYDSSRAVVKVTLAILLPAAFSFLRLRLTA